MQWLPNPIRDEKDLDLYKKYIENDSLIIDCKTNMSDSEKFLIRYLSSNINKIIKAEYFINSRPITKIGVLVTVDSDYFVLRSLKDSSQIICDLNSVKFITVLRCH